MLISYAESRKRSHLHSPRRKSQHKSLCICRLQSSLHTHRFLVSPPNKHTSDIQRLHHDQRQNPKQMKAAWLVSSTIPSLHVLCLCVAIKNTSTCSHTTQNILGAACKCVHYCLSLNETETKTLQKGSSFSHNRKCIIVGFTCSHDTLSHIL